MGITIRRNKWAPDSEGNWYYVGSDGKIVTNDWKTDSENNWHYVGSDGKMAKNQWAQDRDGIWYHLEHDGKMKTGWLEEKGEWYYFDPSGKMQTGTVTIDRKDYNFNSSGQLQVTNEINEGGERVTIDGREYSDYTEAINDMLQRNEQECLEHRNDLDMGLSWFRDKVNYDAPWDIKMEKRWKEQMSSVPYLGPDKDGNYGKFVIDGRVTTAEELGNFTFGYWGAATGYGEELLNLGAGSAQIKHDHKVSFPKAIIEAIKDGAPHYGDNPEDTAQINEGIEYYFKTHPNQAKIGDAGDIFDGPVS